MTTSPPTLCLTPPGFETTGGTTYEWITSWLTDGLAADGFGLVVGQGTLEENDGSWAYVNRQDLPLEHGAPPIARADVHLVSDSWQEDGRKVWVTAPADRTPAPPVVQMRQTVWHEFADGTTEPYYGDRLHETDDTLTIQVESTSFFSSVFDFAWETFRWIRGKSVGSPTCTGTPPPSGSSHTGALLNNGPGGLIGECTYGNAGVPGALGAIDRVRAEVSVYLQSTRRVQITAPGAGDNLVDTVIAEIWELFGSREVASFASDNNLYLPPETPRWVSNTFVAPASYGTYEITPATGPTLASLVMGVVYDFVAKPLIEDYIEEWLVAQGVPRARIRSITPAAFSDFVSCAYNFYRSVPSSVGGLVDLTYTTIKTCVPVVFNKLVAEIADELEDFLEDDRVREIINSLLRSRISFDFLDDLVDSAIVHDEILSAATQGVATLVDLLRVATGNPVHSLWAPAPRPTHLDTGEAIPGGCIASDGNGGYTVQRRCVVPPTPPGGVSEYIVNVGHSNLAFLVRHGRNVGEFASGGDYICAAMSLPVRFVKDITFAEVYGESEARLRCPTDVGGTPRNLAAADNMILRQADRTSYFKNSSTLVGIEHILDGGCFEQLATDYYGYDYVTREEVQSVLHDGWEIDDASAACQG